MSSYRVIPMADSSREIDRDDLKPTVLPDDFINCDTAKRIMAFRMPRYEGLPSMMLYRDQVITYIEDALAPLALDSDDPWVTPSMINNYVKMHLVPSPEKKQYGKPQIASILVICIFKQVLPMSVIKSLFKMQKLTYKDSVAFNYVGSELENAIRSSFSSKPIPVDDIAQTMTRESLLVRSVVTSFAARNHLLAYMKYADLL